MANLSTMFGRPQDVETRSLVRNGSMAGSLQEASLDRGPLPQPGAGELAQYLERRGSAGGASFAGQGADTAGVKRGRLSDLTRLLMLFRLLNQK